jgi:CubicO group peptidase (beta-lactamase class C family)
MDIDIHGHCDARFKQLRDIFEQNFLDDQEVGASLAVTVEGEVVVDLWAGYTNPRRDQLWQQDTVVLVFSSTKFPVTLCAYMLLDQGRLDLDTPVCHYWPEFAQNGKSEITVRQIFTHTACVPSYDPPIPFSLHYNWDAISARLAEQAPWWPPGSVFCYHGATYGNLLGELIRRVDGRTPGVFLREEITSKLDIDFHLGADMSVVRRMAEIIPVPEELLEVPGDKRFVNALQPPSWEGMECLRSEMPSTNGLGNARSLAQLADVMALDGRVGHHQFFSSAITSEALKEQIYARDKDNDLLIRLGLGLGLNSKEFECPSDGAIHWGGAGGSFLIADQNHRTSIGYAMNRMLPGFGDDPRTDPMRLAFNAILRG